MGWLDRAGSALAMRKYWYFQSKKDRKHRTDSSVEVVARTRGKVDVGIAFSESLFMSSLTPQQAREMAAALIERADEAEAEGHE